MTTPRVFLLPKDTPSSSSSNLTVVTLPHPRTSAPTRFLLHPETGLHEITKVVPHTATPQSWLFTNTPNSASSSDKDQEAPTPESSDWLGNGQIIQDASLYVSTPADPLFVLLPHLLPATVDTPKSHFLPLDDILETISAIDDDAEDNADKSHWEAVLKIGSFARRQVEARIKAVCDTVDIGRELAYRPSQEKVLALLTGKCEEMVKGGLPKSMEDTFVLKPLARPITEALEEKNNEDVVTEGETTVLVVGKKSGGEEEEEPVDKQKPLPTPPDSQPSPLSVSESILHLLRLRVASQFLSVSYLPPHIAPLLTAALTAAHDFAPLDTYLLELKRLRTEVVALRSADFTLKRNFDEDGGDGSAKRRKKEEEEEAEKKRKKNISKGVRDLGKVNTRGMAKMTSFFKKG